MLLQKQQEYLAEQAKYEERQRIEKEIQEKNRLSQIKNKNKEEESEFAMFRNLTKLKLVQ